jgi:hypothetical protein
MLRALRMGVVSRAAACGLPGGGASLNARVARLRAAWAPPAPALGGFSGGGAARLLRAGRAQKPAGGATCGARGQARPPHAQPHTPARASALCLACHHAARAHAHNRRTTSAGLFR